MFTPRNIKNVSKTVQKEPSKPKEVKKPTKTRRRTTNFGFSMPRRVSIKRTHEQIPEETSPVKQDKPYKPGAARKLRRVTAEFDSFAAFRPGRKSQRRISDIMEIKRTSPIKPIEVKKAEKKVLSPKSAAIRKVAELSTVMCPSPDRMMTRANTKLLSRTSNRRRTLAWSFNTFTPCLYRASVMNLWRCTTHFWQHFFLSYQKLLLSY